MAPKVDLPAPRSPTNAIPPRLQVNAAEVLDQDTASFHQFRRWQLPQKLGGVHQVHGRLGPVEHEGLQGSVQCLRDLSQQ
jgi:hypothetical protein